jgi:hypothetical protein
MYTLTNINIKMAKGFCIQCKFYKVWTNRHNNGDKDNNRNSFLYCYYYPSIAGIIRFIGVKRKKEE